MVGKPQLRVAAQDIVFECRDFVAVDRKHHWPRGTAPLERALVSFFKLRDGEALPVRSLLPTTHWGIELLAKTQDGFGHKHKICTEIHDPDKGATSRRELTFVHPVTGESVSLRSRHEQVNAATRDGTRYLLFYKPYGVLCQFTTMHKQKLCLADYDLPQGVYPVGRLDKDSEGLVILTNDKTAQKTIADPKAKVAKTYWVQVERVPDDSALQALEQGVRIKGYMTKPARARLIELPDLPPRDPPIRQRKSVPTAWLEIIIREGKNRQVRRMTAAVGFPTLRLVRVAVGDFRLGSLQPGQFIDVSEVSSDV